MRCFATHGIGNYDLVSRYYGTILSSETEVPWSRMVLCEGPMFSAIHKFEILIIRLGQNTKQTDSQSFNGSLVAAKLYAVQQLSELHFRIR